MKDSVCLRRRMRGVAVVVARQAIANTVAKAKEQGLPRSTISNILWKKASPIPHVPRSSVKLARDHMWMVQRSH